MQNQTTLPKLAVLFSLLLWASTLFGQNPYSAYNHWVVDDLVSAIATDGNNTYIGGRFDYAGPPTPYGAKISKTNINPDLTYVRPNGQVSVVIPDGSGGWYLGGAFTGFQVDSATTIQRNYLAHVFANGTLDMVWNPDANGVVNVLILNATNLYVAGQFTTLGGLPRNRVAKVSISGSGAVDPLWDPNANNNVLCMALDGLDLYLGGDFTTMGGVARNRVAKVSSSGSGILDPVWDPNANSTVHCMEKSGSDLFVGGQFFSIGGNSIAKLAKLSSSGTGASDPLWNPNPGNHVYSLFLSGTSLYVSGFFTTIGGLSRSRIARLSTTGSGVVDPVWNPNANAPVHDYLLFGDTLYVVGDFLTIGGQNRRYAARLSTTGTGLADPSWDPNVQATCRTIAISNNNADLYIGGSFFSIGGVTRNRLAKFDANGQLDLNWAPTVTGNVDALILSGNELIAGGTFTQVNGTSRNRLAKVSTLGIGALDPTWNPMVGGGDVNCLLLDGTELYVGGNFSQIGATSRQRLARISLSGTGTLHPLWNITASSRVRAMAKDGNDLFIAGDFSTVSGVSRMRLAKVSTLGAGSVDPNWNPGANNLIYCLGISGSSLYVGGAMTIISGQNRNRLVKLSTTGTGQLDLTWNPNPNNIVNTMAIAPPYLYVGGGFSAVGGLTRYSLAKVNLNGNGAVEPTWNPHTSNNVVSMALSGNFITVGGDFVTVGLKPRNRVAKLSTFINAALPVNLTFFKGEANSEGNKLEWQTGSELNNAAFVIQRSSDARNYISLDTIYSLAENGNSSHPLHYPFFDLNPEHGPNYYRLLQIDLDGNQQYVDKVVRLDHTLRFPLLIYPNPASDFCTVSFHAANAGRLIICLRDKQGHTVKQEWLEAKVGKNSFRLDMRSFSRGMYFIQVVNNNQIVESCSLLKE